MSCFKLTPDAKASLMQIARYTQQKWGKTQRNAYLKTIDASFHTLNASPKLGKRRLEIHPSLRSYPVGKHIVFYVIAEEYIVIVDVLHERMEPDKNLELSH